MQPTFELQFVRKGVHYYIEHGPPTIDPGDDEKAEAELITGFPAGATPSRKRRLCFPIWSDEPMAKKDKIEESAEKCGHADLEARWIAISERTNRASMHVRTLWETEHASDEERQQTQEDVLTDRASMGADHLTTLRGERESEKENIAP
jgi:hypothetical protein